MVSQRGSEQILVSGIFGPQADCKDPFPFIREFSIFYEFAFDQESLELSIDTEGPLIKSAYSRSL